MRALGLSCRSQRPPWNTASPSFFSDSIELQDLGEKLDTTNVGEVVRLVLFFLPRKREAAFLQGMLTESLRNGAAAHRIGGRGRGAQHRGGRCDRERRRSVAARSREVAAP